jgi:hypothetical protein
MRVRLASGCLDTVSGNPTIETLPQSWLCHRHNLKANLRQISSKPAGTNDVRLGLSQFSGLAILGGRVGERRRPDDNDEDHRIFLIYAVITPP